MTEAALAAEYWQLKQQETVITERLGKLRESLIKTTGQRRAGSFMVKVDSSNREIMDQEAAKEALQGAGILVPMKVSPQVRLTVKPWVDLPPVAVEGMGVV